MNREIITRLIESTNSDDVDLGLMLLNGYRLADIKKMLKGTQTSKQNSWQVELNTNKFRRIRHIKYHSSLYVTVTGLVLYFHTQPRKGFKDEDYERI